MQWLSLVTEDAGVQRLKADTRLRVALRSLDGVAPCPSLHTVQTDAAEHRQRLPRRERRQQERRRAGDRRQQQLPVFLDTRSRQDRRQPHNRRLTWISENPQVTARARLDLYV
jgi:hypothetical protein